MTLEDFNGCSLVEMPAADGEVRASGEQQFAIVVHGHAGHSSLVSLERPQHLACLKVPGAGREVRGARDQQILGGVRVRFF